jgi:hypothetical protein
MDYATIDVPRRNIVTGDTDFGAFIRLGLVALAVVISLSIGYFLRGVTSNANAAIHNTADETIVSQLENEVSLLRGDVERLKQSNSSLRNEMTTLTTEDGVVDKIILHLRELKAEDQALLNIIAPLNRTASEGEETTQPVAGTPVAVEARADHQIVTPRERAPPLPVARPDDRPAQPEAQAAK